MRYFYDTEFIEDGLTIDLISIGIVAEDGREYYAQSVEYDEKDANEWVQACVFPHLVSCSVYPDQLSHARIPGKCYAPDCPWRTRRQIATEVYDFIKPARDGNTPELWAYYGAYDHVALCQLWGPMAMLPAGVPMFTHDLVQLLSHLIGFTVPEHLVSEHNALADAHWNHLVYHQVMTHILEKRKDFFPQKENSQAEEG